MFSVNLYKKLSPFLNSISIHQSLIFFEFYCNNSTSLHLSSTDHKRNKKSLEKDKSFAVSYLMNSFGFSHERAVSISAKTHFNDTEKPNSVLALLQSYGFSESQIAALVRIRPVTLLAKETSISPKLDFFLSVGMSKTILTKFISGQPYWLQRSLDNYIIPNYNFLKTYLLTDQRVVVAITRYPRVFNQNAEKRFAPNVKVLRELKVPQSCICLLLQHFPEAFVVRSSEFQESVSKVLEMGFDPLKSTFVLALHAVSGKCNQATWDQCYETYTSWGWSKEDIYMALRKSPGCMLLSRNKIDRVMDFLVNKIGFDAKVIAQTPSVLFFSLEKRIRPRFAVFQVLLSKGLIKHYSLNTVLSPAEKYFLDKFVIPFEKEVPKLYDLYKGNIGVVDL